MEIESCATITPNRFPNPVEINVPVIPRKLRLINFLSYRDESELDFQEIHVACLCGDNGHGKSALLDAITWCLWGWARGHRYGQGGTSPDELVHQGQSEMEVSLDFLVDATYYRVVRKYSMGARSRSPALILDLQISAEEEFRSIAEGSAQETEGAIRRLLHMDYETFLNSSFLLQGHADRFATSTPTRRKETLAEILGLALYERLEERAKDEVKRHDLEVRSGRSELQRLDDDLSRKPEYEECLFTTKQELEELDSVLESVVLRLSGFQEQVRELERIKGEDQQAREGLARLNSEAERLETHVGESRKRLEDYKKVLTSTVEINEGVQAHKETRNQLEDLDIAQSRHGELSQKKLRLEHQISGERISIEGKLAHLRNHLEEELIPREHRIPELEGTLAATVFTLKELQNRENAIAQVRQELQQTIVQSETLENDNRRLLSDMEELRRKLDLLGTVGAACPLCGTPLGINGQEHLEREFNLQGQHHKTQYQTNERVLQELSATRENREKELSLQERKLKEEGNQTLERQGAIGRELEECRRAALEAKKIQESIQELMDGLERNSFAMDSRAALAELEPMLNQLEYQPDLHQRTRRRLQELESFIGLNFQLQEAGDRLPQEVAALADLEALLGSRQVELTQLGEKLKEVTQALTKLPDLVSQMQALLREQQELEERRTSIQQEVHLYTMRLEALEETQARHTYLEWKTTDHEKQQGTYTLLAESFGKRGIQALLIEAALPELESLANELLGRLTEGRMSLTLETQTLRRRGDVAETLEIHIADELGTRNYELFSGGEAFRISFALRIALAKLLASRTGAPLRSLFLDEGFGTQDVEGRERLVEAINAIQDDFDLILVITHIEDLKEAFPVRIEVIKSEEQGSTFELVWV